MFANTTNVIQNGQGAELLFNSTGRPGNRPELSFSERAFMRVLKFFAAKDFDGLERQLNLCTEDQLKELFEQKGYAILHATTLKPHALAINFLAQKVPNYLTKMALSANNYELVRTYLIGETGLDKSGKSNETDRQLRREFFKAFLEIDKEGVINLFDNAESVKEIIDSTSSVKEDFKAALKSMPESPQKKVKI